MSPVTARRDNSIAIRPACLSFLSLLIMVTLIAVGCDDAQTGGTTDAVNDMADTSGDGIVGPCPGANPARVATCTDDTDCASGEVCAPVDDCVPSSCFCDEATGSWGCTTDCGMPNVCQPGTPGTCTEPDPSDVETCSGDADCAADETCAPSSDCVPSTCNCDPDTGEWLCTLDCGMPNVCQPDSPGACTEPDPSDVETCGSDVDCAIGEICAPSDDCVPSSCTCDTDSGSWICTEDCGMPNVCQPDSPTTCSGPDPSDVDTCASDADCADGDVCAPSSDCVPSTCSCDEATGTWTCTADCGMPDVCQPDTSACTDPDPSDVETCGSDADCATDEICAPSTECVPSTCSCDTATGTWMCTKDCRMPSVCQADTSACTDPNPAGCSGDQDCGADEVCTFDSNSCLPSSCTCDASTGTWACTEDCGGGTCQTGLGACTSDADCASGEQWCESGQCVQCDNSGLTCTIACPEGWVLEQRNGCHPCNCVPDNECTSDADCNGQRTCQAGDMCLSWCSVGDPSCCYGNTCG